MDREGRYIFADPAPRELVVECERSGRKFEWIVPASIAETTVEMPRHGHLVVELESAGTSWPPDAWRGVLVRALDGEPIGFRVQPRAPKGEALARSGPDAFLPGRYRVELYADADTERDGAGTATGVRADVEIRAGETTMLRWGN